MSEVLISKASKAVPIHLVSDAKAFVESASPYAARLAEAVRFKGKPGEVFILPDAEGAPLQVVAGAGEPGKHDPLALRSLPGRLPPGDYRLAEFPEGLNPHLLALAWAFGAYRFDRYKQKHEPSKTRLVSPDGVDLTETLAIAHACALARDMTNSAPNDLGPLQIETIAREIAEQFKGAITVTVGDDLLEAGYPAVHAVGRAADANRAPRMIEVAWGDPSHPVVALVGKGVVFDTGGLDIKPSAGMRLMKKDMGGAAHALALARMVMAAGLPVRLVVLLPVVENAIGGRAMRPSDVLSSRKGLTIEVGNTDAEGRLILADALTRAAEHQPDLTIDLATLTGAARVALGPQVIPFYTDDEALAAELAQASLAQADPIWRMPLWSGYEDALESEVADLQNDPANWAQAGSVTAALFLKRFAPETSWVHFDIFAWNPRARPGHPVGAEVQAIRAVYAVLKSRYR